MKLKLCNRCKKIIDHSEKYCSKCLAIVTKEKEESKIATTSRYNKTRDPKYKQFYNSNSWKILKEKKLQDEQYRCEYNKCLKLATDVHHKKLIQTEEGWLLRLDYDNLECLCIEHHNKRHNRFQKRRRCIK